MQQRPSIGRIVIYRSRTGDYDVPAVVTATAETLNQEGVEAGHVPPLTSIQNVHLTVLTPGKPGMRRDAEDFKVESPHGRSENVSGTYQEWDIAPAGNDSAPEPGSWRLADDPRGGALMDERRPPEGSGTSETIGFSRLALAGFACELAGGAIGIAMRDNPDYVMPAEELGQLVREYVRGATGFDVAELPGYRGTAGARPWITKAQAQLLIGVLEEEAGEVIEREDIARAIGALRDVAGLNLSRAQTHEEPHEGLEQARQTRSEVD